MRYLSLVGIFLLFVACDDDDPSDLVDACRQEVAFLVDGDGRCLSGFATTQSFGITVTNIALLGVDDEQLTFVIAELTEGDNDLPEASATYTDPMGETYDSILGGTLTVSELGDELEGNFNFMATNGVDTIAVTDGVIENLQFN